MGFFFKLPWIKDTALGIIVVIGLFLIVSIITNTTKVSDVHTSVVAIDTALHTAVSEASADRASNFQIEKDLLTRIVAKQDTLMMQQDSLIRLLREGLE